ncbi:NADH dehydrogenase (ubiquinone) complex I, assembly factor 6 homolog [Culicoides brevitarsis]|uniref:NADH dehydrogenase (ubiquinone) complex I, assembly factor 6 homolog n=1 Tax=Culicoides brevitarsis TaxID=469753 RepID=UPI00307BAA24
MNCSKNARRLLNVVLRSYKYERRFASTDPKANAGYCMENVRKYDYENFLATLLLKNSVQSTITIRAFNVEISRISQITSDDKIAAMRLKFWDEAIDKIYDKNTVKVPDHPVVNEVHLLTQRQKLTKQFFKRLIACRNRPRNQGFLTMKQLEEYAEASVSNVYYLSLEASGLKNVHADHACSHLGKAQGIVNMLRSIPQLTRGQGLPIPQEVLMKHGVSQERVIRATKDDKGVEECIFEVATLAHQHLEKARKLVDSLPKEAKPFLLPGVAVQRYLDRLRLVNFELTHQTLMRRDAMLPAWLYWNRLKGTF